ncbi:carbon-nitrogen hydrolase [Artomyces pyxidatus]|uniref:Carbon-nitrogen hydrolase n=1 Tax=Artomyces pyxidatus TaxID=48021 RepID=A0ACB8T6C5_9AGAM|nr:carbon-nitrogen hydrolase [Artomyces pyxidatus]
MATSHVPLRVGVVQFAPQLGQVQDNIDKAQRICSKIQPRSIDLLCLPEMIFSGYCFPDSDSITPFLEHPRTGPTARFCAEWARRLQCHVVAGFPERLEADEVEPGVDHEGNAIERVGANSAVLCGPDGWVGGYRKTNLFRVDTTWAKPGTGFATFHLPSPIGTVTLGICMDLNVQPPTLWTVKDGPYEIAQHCIDTNSNLLVMLNAWLDSGESPEEDEDWQTIRFWSARLRPLWAANSDDLTEVSDGSETPEANASSDGRRTTVVLCNRCGDEDGVVFAGSSTLFSFQQGTGKPRILEVMERNEEDVGIWEARYT